MFKPSQISRVEYDTSIRCDSSAFISLKLCIFSIAFGPFARALIVPGFRRAGLTIADGFIMMD